MNDQTQKGSSKSRPQYGRFKICNELTPEEVDSYFSPLTTEAQPEKVQPEEGQPEKATPRMSFGEDILNLSIILSQIMGSDNIQPSTYLCNNLAAVAFTYANNCLSSDLKRQKAYFDQLESKIADHNSKFPAPTKNSKSRKGNKRKQVTSDLPPLDPIKTPAVEPTIPPSEIETNMAHSCQLIAQNYHIQLPFGCGVDMLRTIHNQFSNKGIGEYFNSDPISNSLIPMPSTLRKTLITDCLGHHMYRDSEEHHWGDLSHPNYHIGFPVKTRRTLLAAPKSDDEKHDLWINTELDIVTSDGDQLFWCTPKSKNIEFDGRRIMVVDPLKPLRVNASTQTCANIPSNVDSHPKFNCKFSKPCRYTKAADCIKSVNAIATEVLGFNFK